MKRHPSLVTLSFHHQHVLVQARQLIKASTTDSSQRRSVAEKFLTLWREKGIEHFRQEEEILLPTYARFGDSQQAQVLELLRQHTEIRSMVDSVSEAMNTDQGPEANLLRKLGETLDAHVRLEEHEVFPLVEAAVPEAELERLKKRLDP